MKSTSRVAWLFGSAETVSGFSPSSAAAFGTTAPHSVRPAGPRCALAWSPGTINISSRLRVFCQESAFLRTPGKSSYVMTVVREKALNRDVDVLR